MAQVNIFHILIVEDNGAHVRLVKEAFREILTPHSIFVANDGEDALDFLYRRGVEAGLQGYL